MFKRPFDYFGVRGVKEEIAELEKAQADDRHSPLNIKEGKRKF